MMTAQTTATVENGVLKPDTALPFPDRTRVRLTIETMPKDNQAWAAWKAFLAKVDEHPIVGLTGKNSRDELYDRD